MQEVVIDSIRVSQANYQGVVILKEKSSNMYLPILVKPEEADSIAATLQDVAVPRPLTHDLLNLVITTLGGAVSHIVVSELLNATFYAKIAIKMNGSSFEVDSRPSDAIALAVRAGYVVAALESKKYFKREQCAESYVAIVRWYKKDLESLDIRPVVPIYVEDVVMEKVGVALDKETGKPVIGGEPEDKAAGKMTEDELRRLSALVKVARGRQGFWRSWWEKLKGGTDSNKI